VAIPWKVLGAGALAVGALVYPAAWALDRAAGIDLLIVTAADDASVAANRGLWEMDGGPKKEIPSIYGTPGKEPMRFVFVPAERVFRPKEDPSLALYLLREGDHPLQSQTLYFFALPTAIGAVVTGVILLLLGRRKAKSA
jgi:hypothetical protein